MTHNRVLIPLDGSTWSRKVLPKIRTLFDPASYELILFRAADAPDREPVEPVVSTLLAGMYPGDDPIHRTNDANRTREMVHAWHRLERAEHSLENELEHDAQALRDEGYTVKVAVHFGDPAEEIAFYTQYQDVDMVAMATHARTGFNRLLHGSVAEQLVHDLPVPVLLIRPDA